MSSSGCLVFAVEPVNSVSELSPVADFHTGVVLRQTFSVGVVPNCTYARLRCGCNIDFHQIAHKPHVAGGEAKCRYVTEELGFDACVNYKSGDLVASLASACPNGIDIYFENVGGAVFAAVIRLLNRGARIPLCGVIADYNTPSSSVPSLLPLLVSRAMLQGFIVSDHFDRFAAAAEEMAPLVRAGRLKYREDIAEGLDAAPEAFIGLLQGRNFGKALVRVSPDPTR